MLGVAFKRDRGVVTAITHVYSGLLILHVSHRMSTFESLFPGMLGVAYRGVVTAITHRCVQWFAHIACLINTSMLR